MEHQQHLGKVRIEYPDLHRQRVGRTGTGGGQPTGDVVELDRCDTNVSHGGLQRPPLQLVAGPSEPT
jgi:hypothetical protein